MKRISILCYDVSVNALGRAYILAKMLQTRYEVRIIGPAFSDNIWLPLRGNDIECRFIHFGKGFTSYRKLKDLINLIDGDILYISKPLFTSYIIGLLGRKNRPIVLDIDDWEWGFVKDWMNRSSLFKCIKGWLKSIIYPCRKNGYFGAWISQKLIPLTDHITVSNKFLQARFGGTLVPHARDEKAFLPESWDQYELKQKYNIDASKKVVMFFGTPRRHKGIKDLIKAVDLIPDERVHLSIVGIDNQDKYCMEISQTATNILGSRFKGFGPCSFEKIPEFLALSDIIAIPQQRNMSTQEQMPAKVFDAMAMAKPIVASEVSDIPIILDNCGWLVEPNSPHALAKAITEIINNEKEAKIRRMQARSRFLKNYSWAAIRPRLFSVFSQL